MISCYGISSYVWRGTDAVDSVPDIVSYSTIVCDRIAGNRRHAFRTWSDVAKDYSTTTVGHDIIRVYERPSGTTCCRAKLKIVAMRRINVSIDYYNSRAVMGYFAIMSIVVATYFVVVCVIPHDLDTVVFMVLNRITGTDGITLCAINNNNATIVITNLRTCIGPSQNPVVPDRVIVCSASRNEDILILVVGDDVVIDVVVLRSIENSNP